MFNHFDTEQVFFQLFSYQNYFLLKSYTSRYFCVLHAFIIQYFNQSFQQKGNIWGERNDSSGELSMVIDDSLKWDHNEFINIDAWYLCNK